MLLNLDLIPVDTDTGVGDGEALFLIGSLDLDLHDSFLEESHVEVEMSGAELHRVGEVFVLVQVESSVDGILMDDQAIGLDVISSHQMVALHAVLEFFLATMMLVLSVTGGLVMVARKHLAESVAEVFDTAGLFVFVVEFVVTVVAV